MVIGKFSRAAQRLQRRPHVSGVRFMGISLL
jgi:hypothetical protein